MKGTWTTINFLCISSDETTNLLYDLIVRANGGTPGRGVQYFDEYYINTFLKYQYDIF